MTLTWLLDQVLKRSTTGIDAVLTDTAGFFSGERVPHMSRLTVDRAMDVGVVAQFEGIEKARASWSE